MKTNTFNCVQLYIEHADKTNRHIDKTDRHLQINRKIVQKRSKHRNSYTDTKADIHTNEPTTILTTVHTIKSMHTYYIQTKSHILKYRLTDIQTDILTDIQIGIQTDIQTDIFLTYRTTYKLTYRLIY